MSFSGEDQGDTGNSKMKIIKSNMKYIVLFLAALLVIFCIFRVLGEGIFGNSQVELMEIPKTESQNTKGSENQWDLPEDVLKNESEPEQPPSEVKAQGTLAMPESNEEGDENIPKNLEAQPFRESHSSQAVKPGSIDDSKITNNSGEKTCTISIRCDTILNNMERLAKGKEGLVPENGIILETQIVTFSPGESVFDILKRVTKDNKIHMEFVNTPVNNTAYIEGIGNLYEFDCGELSGWLYKVNGEFPGYGSYGHTVEEGDEITWVYSCDLGRDVRAERAVRQQ